MQRIIVMLPCANWKSIRHRVKVRRFRKMRDNKEYSIETPTTGWRKEIKKQEKEFFSSFVPHGTCRFNSLFIHQVNLRNHMFMDGTPSQPRQGMNSRKESKLRMTCIPVTAPIHRLFFILLFIKGKNFFFDNFQLFFYASKIFLWKCILVVKPMGTVHSRNFSAWELHG